MRKRDNPRDLRMRFMNRGAQIGDLQMELLASQIRADLLVGQVAHETGRTRESVKGMIDGAISAKGWGDLAAKSWLTSPDGSTS